jgi:hypothetical protein
MSTQTEQRALSVKPGEQQTQSSQRKEMARSSPRTGFLQRRVIFIWTPAARILPG